MHYVHPKIRFWYWYTRYHTATSVTNSVQQISFDTQTMEQKWYIQYIRYICHHLPKQRPLDVGKPYCNSHTHRHENMWTWESRLTQPNRTGEWPFSKTRVEQWQFTKGNETIEIGGSWFTAANLQHVLVESTEKYFELYNRWGVMNSGSAVLLRCLDAFASIDGYLLVVKHSNGKSAFSSLIFPAGTRQCPYRDSYHPFTEQYLKGQHEPMLSEIFWEYEALEYLRDNDTKRQIEYPNYTSRKTQRKLMCHHYASRILTNLPCDLFRLVSRVAGNSIQAGNNISRAPWNPSTTYIYIGLVKWCDMRQSNMIRATNVWHGYGMLIKLTTPDHSTRNISDW